MHLKIQKLHRKIHQNKFLSNLAQAIIASPAGLAKMVVAIACLLVPKMSIGSVESMHCA